MRELKDKESKLLEKWLEDESFINWATNRDEKETAKWEHYFNINPQHWELGKLGRSMVLGIPFKKINPYSKDKEQSLKALLARVESNSGQITDKPRVAQKVKLFHLQKGWLVAASLIGLLVTSTLLYRSFFNETEVFLRTEYGQQLNSQLPDGSVVTLNANSSLKYSTSNPRKVWIEGEAFFEITKKPKTGENFQVITPDLTVTVFGTAFNVNSRNDQTKVFLEEGKVDLETLDPEIDVIKMKPGDLVSYSRKRKSLEHKTNNVSSLQTSSWKVGALIFKDTPLPEALFQIEDIHGIQFVLESESLRRDEISGGVPINDLEATLETLHEVHNIIIRQDGHRYFLTKSE